MGNFKKNYFLKRDPLQKREAIEFSNTTKSIISEIFLKNGRRS